MSHAWRNFFLIVLLTIVSAVIALPTPQEYELDLLGRKYTFMFGSPQIDTTVLGQRINPQFALKQGLDIQGGMQVVLKADMSEIVPEDRDDALQSAQDVIARRVDFYGINEPLVQTSRQGEEYRLIVELPGVDEPDQALQLIGRTAELEFKLESTPSAQASPSAALDATASAFLETQLFLDSFKETGLTGQQLQKAAVQFDPQTGEPVIGLAFDQEGREKFAQITRDNVGKVLAIFIDGFPVAMPSINQPILDGQAVMTGGFTVEQAQQLAIQLNAGALPVPIEILEQRVVGASLGQDSINKTVKAGLVGLGLVMLFMILNYGYKGLIAVIGLICYGIYTVALYKLIGVTVTVPGIAGLLLSIGMAVDSNILIFERMKEELRVGRPFAVAMEKGFGRAWNSIKDANTVTILISLLLINPLNFSFLNTSGLVRGFGVTLLLGIVVSLFTGLVVTRTLMRLFLSAPAESVKPGLSGISLLGRKNGERGQDV